MLNETETALNVKNSVQPQIQHYILSDVSTRTPSSASVPPGPLSDDSRRTQNTHRRVLSFKSAFRKHTYHTLNTDACFDPDPFK